MDEGTATFTIARTMSHLIKAHRRRGSTPPILDTCHTGPVDATRIKRVLALTYERFCSEAEGLVASSGDHALIEALGNCWMRCRSSIRLNELETLRRLCAACYYRLQSDVPIHAANDLAYLDALQDAINCDWPWEWKITKELELFFRRSLNGFAGRKIKFFEIPEES